MAGDIELRARITATDQASAVIKGVSNATKGLIDAVTNAQKSTTSLSQSMATAGQNMISAGKNTQWLGRQFLYNVTVPIVGVATAAVKMAFDFDKAMSQVKAAASSTAVISQEQYSKMKEAVLEVSKTSIQSATDITKGFYELVSAGYSVEESMRMLADVTQFATASALDVGTAAQFASAQLHAWSGTGITLKEIMDKTAVAVQATQLHFDDFVHSAEMAGSMGREAGQSFDEMSIALMAMADRGVVAGKMGFYLRAIFQDLATGEENAAKAGIDMSGVFTDTSGNIRPLSNIAKDFGEKLSGVSSQQERLTILTKVFGRNAATGFIPIMEAATQNTGLFSNETEKLAQSMVDGEGSAADFSGEIKNTAKSLDEYLQMVKDSEGATKRMSDAVNSTDYAKMQIAINNLKAAGIEMGMKLMPILSKLVDNYLIPLIKKIEDLSPKTQKWMLAITGLVAVMGPLLIIIGMMKEGLGLIMMGISKLISPSNILATSFLGIAAVILTIVGSVVGFDNLTKAILKWKDAIIAVVAIYEAFKLGNMINGWIRSYQIFRATIVAGTEAVAAFTIAQNGSVVAVKGMTAAQWSLNAAMDANPIGIVIAALTVVVAIGYKLSTMNWFQNLNPAIQILISPLGSLINLFNILKQKTDDSATAINNLKTITDTFFNATAEYNQANLTLATTTATRNRLTEELAQLERDGKTDTDEYKVATAQLKVTNDELAKAQTDVETTKKNADKALADKTGLEVARKSIEDANSQLGPFVENWNNIHDKTVQLNIKTVETVTKYVNQAILGSGGIDNNPDTPYASGGIIPTTGTYMMHKGERVTPEGSHTQSGGEVTVNAYFYGDINESSGDLGTIGKKLSRSLELSRQGIS